MAFGRSAEAGVERCSVSRVGAVCALGNNLELFTFVCMLLQSWIVEAGVPGQWLHPALQVLQVGGCVFPSDSCSLGKC